MPTLLLLNGPPGVGKSTLAVAWSERENKRACVDPDLLRLKHPDPSTPAARLAAREAALGRVQGVLEEGNSVVVAQLCGRPDFPDRLRSAAEACGATFVEVVLLDSLEHLRRRLRERADSAEPHHRLAAAELNDVLLHDYRAAVVERASTTTDIVVLDCPEGQQDITLRAIDQVIRSA